MEETSGATAHPNAELETQTSAWLRRGNSLGHKVKVWVVPMSTALFLLHPQDRSFLQLGAIHASAHANNYSGLKTKAIEQWKFDHRILCCYYTCLTTKVKENMLSILQYIVLFLLIEVVLWLCLKQLVSWTVQ